MEGVSMKYFLDKQYAIADHTIITYSGNNISLKIPEKIKNISIRSIGAGALMDLKELQYIMLPPKLTSIGNSAFANDVNLATVILPGTIKTIGTSAFSNCKQLTDITIYDYLISEQEYTALKNSSFRAAEDIYVAHHMPKIEIIDQILNSALSWGPKAACCVPGNINRLFYTAQAVEDDGFQLMYRNLNNICFIHKHSKPTTEDSGFVEYLDSHSEYTQIELSDEMNDKYLRINKLPSYQKTAIFTLNDRETKDVNGKKSISMTLKFGFFFCQSACKVICEGKQYYVYRRYYLSPDEKMQFARRDVAIYTDEGVVMDKKEAQKVYAKYKFLCIL